MKRSISQSLDDSSESGRRTPDGVTRPAFLELFRIAAYNTGQVFVAGQTKLAKEKIKRDKDGYVQDAEGKRVPVVLQYSSFDFLKDRAKDIVEAHAKEASQRWNA